MYYLALDTTQNNPSIALFKENLDCVSFLMIREDTGFLLADLFNTLENFLDKEKIDQESIKTIFINRGPGRFTSTRLGIMITRIWVQFKNVLYLSLTSFDILYESAFHFIESSGMRREETLSIILILKGFSKHSYIMHIYRKDSREIYQRYFNVNLEFCLEQINLYKENQCLLIGDFFLDSNEAIDQFLKSHPSQFIIPQEKEIHEINAFKLGKLGLQYILNKKKLLSSDYEKLYPIYENENF